MATATLLAEAAKQAQRAYWWIEIEGIQHRFGSRDPDWNVPDTGTNQHIVDKILSIPEISGQRASPLDGETESASCTIKLMDEDEEITILFGYHDASIVKTELAAAVTAGDATIDVVDSTGLTANSNIYVERETMRLTAINVGGGCGGACDRLSVTRGMYGSDDVDHALTDSQGNTITVEVWDAPPFIYTRKVIVYEGRHDSLYAGEFAEADAFVLMRGYLESADEHQGIWALQIASFLRLLSTRIGDGLASTKTAYPLWGGHFTEGEGYDYPVDPSGNQWCTFWLVGVEDASQFYDGRAVVQIGDELINYADWGTDGDFDWLRLTTHYGLATQKFEPIPYTDGRGMMGALLLGSHYSDEIAPHDIRIPWFMQYHPEGEEVREVIHCGLGVADYFGTMGHDPLSVFLQLATSTGTLGANGMYDRLPAEWGAGIDEDLIDVDGIEELAKEFQHEITFVINEPTDLLEWCTENIFRPCMVFPVENDEGKITLKRMMTRFDAEQASGVPTITEYHLQGSPTFSAGPSPLGKLTINCNYYPPKDEHYGKVIVLFGDSERKYMSTTRTVEVECNTIYDHNIGEAGATWTDASQGGLPGQIADLIGVLVDRFAYHPCPVVSFTMPYGRFPLYRVGDPIKLTCSKVPDVRNRDRGIDSEYLQIIEENPRPASGTVSYVAWMIGVHDDPYRYIAPAAKVSAYANPGPAGDPRISLYDDTFSNSGFDAEAFAVDDVIALVDDEYVALAGAGAPETVTIKAIGTGVGVCYFDLTAAPANVPGDGDYCITAPYDSAVSDQTDKWCFLADANDELGAAGDDGHVRS